MPQQYAQIVWDTPILDKKSIMMEIVNQDKIVKPLIEQFVRDNIFNPAAKKMEQEFLAHPVTQEILGGVAATNESETLPNFKYEGGANLYSFIGFEESQDENIQKVADALGDGKHPQGPRLKYAGKVRETATMYFEALGPNEQGIHNMTPIPWAPGLSWISRMEVDIPGLSRFLNVDGEDHHRATSRSGGGIETEKPLRTASFKPTPYLTQIIENFLKNIASAKV